MRGPLGRVETLIEAAVRSEFDIIGELGRYAIAGRGKRLRPAIVLLSAAAMGARPTKFALDTAAAVEFIHTATLVHDDIIDGADTRRGKPSVNQKYGPTAAVLFGDFLYCRAFEQVSYKNDAFVARTLLGAARNMCEGELYQNINSFNPEVAVEDYLRVIENKTAQFIARCAALGAYCGGASKARIETMREYGRLLGLAFQIADDIFDIASDEKTIGKPAGNDLREGKLTLPVLYALEKMSHRDADRVRREFKKPGGVTAEFIDSVRKAALDCGAIERARRTAAEYSKKAASIADNLRPATTARESLAALAEFVINREN